MPASDDIRVYINEMVNHGYLGGDVQWFLFDVDPGVNAFIDSLSAAAFEREERPPWPSVQRAAFACEQRYIDWRATDPEHLLVASVGGLEEVKERLGALVEYHAFALTTLGFERFDARARQFVRQRYAFDTQVSVLSRAARRVHHDTQGFAKAMLDRGLEISNELFNEHHPEETESFHKIGAYLDKERMHATRGKPRLKKLVIREGVVKRRRAIVRAIKFAERLLGEDTVRDFVSGKAFRIDGERASYEFVSNGDLGISHGGATLTLYRRGTETKLCKMCIYTPGVPLMDHIASMVMHLRGGEEEFLIATGNAFAVEPAAYDEPWLVPKLPIKAETRALAPGEVRMTAGRTWSYLWPRSNSHAPRLATRFPARTVKLDEAEQMRRIVVLNNDILDYVLERVGPFMPPNRYNEFLLRHGHPPPQELAQSWEPALAA